MTGWQVVFLVIGLGTVGYIAGAVVSWLLRVYGQPPRCVAAGYRCQDEQDPRCVARHCTWHCSLYCGGACRKAWLARERARIARGLAVGAALDANENDNGGTSSARAPTPSTLQSTLPVRWTKRN